MVMTFVLTPQSQFNTIIEPRAHFLFSFLEGLSIDFPSHLIVSVIDIYQNIATRDKLIFPSAITCILTHMHILILSAPLFSIIGAISRESIRRSNAQLAAKAKQPHDESTHAQQEEAAFHDAEDAVFAPQSPSSSAPSSSSRVRVTLAAIMDQLQLMRADFGSSLDHLSDEMCQMNTRIGRIARRQSRCSLTISSQRFCSLFLT